VSPPLPGLVDPSEAYATGSRWATTGAPAHALNACGLSGRLGGSVHNTCDLELLLAVTQLRRMAGSRPAQRLLAIALELYSGLMLWRRAWREARIYAEESLEVARTSGYGPERFWVSAGIDISQTLRAGNRRYRDDGLRALTLFEDLAAKVGDAAGYLRTVGEYLAYLPGQTADALVNLDQSVDADPSSERLVDIIRVRALLEGGQASRATCYLRDDALVSPQQRAFELQLGADVWLALGEAAEAARWTSRLRSHAEHYGLVHELRSAAALEERM